MDMLAGIMVEKQSDLAIMQQAHGVLQALNIPYRMMPM